MFKKTFAALAIAAAAFVTTQAPAQAFSGASIENAIINKAATTTQATQIGYHAKFSFHHRNKRHFNFNYNYGYNGYGYNYVPYTYPSYGYVKKNYDPCAWLRKKAYYTGNHHFFKKYNHCVAKHYNIYH